MSPDDYSKHLKDAGFESKDEAGAKKTIEALRMNPVAFGRVDPPVGYEAQLLAALKRKLPLEQAPAKTITPPRKNFWSSPSLSWMLTGVFAVVALITAVNFNGSPLSYSSDLIARTTEKGGEHEVDNWMASMSDQGLQRRVARADIDTLAQELESSEDRQVVENVLKDVAHTMGMK